MRHTPFRRAFALLLAVLFCMPSALAAAVHTSLFESYSVADVGEVYKAYDQTLGDKTVFTEGTLRHITQGREEERYVTWDAASRLTPMAVYGSKLYGSSLTLTEAEAQLRAKGLSPVFGVNGDYFSFSNGVPNGIMVTDGILRASDNYEWSLCFPASGGAFLAKTPLYTTVTATVGGVSRIISVDQVNHPRVQDRLILFTPDYADTTKTTTQGTHVILNVTGDLKIGQPITGTVDKVVTGTEPAVLKAGQMVLSADAKGPVSRISGLTAGTQVSISVSCEDARFKTLTCALGGYQKLLTNGQIESGLPAGAGPRTAVGIKADGQCVFYTVDGRQQGYSGGLTLTELARRLKSLGCVEALNLDGGGSTIMGVTYPGQAAMTTVNKPSEGTPRKVSNYIFFVNNLAKQTVPTRLFVFPAVATLLKDAYLPLSCYATDDNYHALTVPPITWSGSDEIGSVAQNGFYTALSAGVSEVSAAAAGSLTGRATIRVVDMLESVSILNEKSGQALSSLTVAPGETLDLAARGYYNYLPVSSQDSCFIWSAVGNIGTIDQNGLFTASMANGATGIIYASYGNTSAALPVGVGRAPEVLEDFEKSSTAFGSGDDTMAFTVLKEVEKAPYGLRAGSIRYNFAGLPAGQTALSLPVSITVPDGAGYVNLWLTGDNSKNIVSLTVADASGKETDMTLATLDFSGNRLLHLKLPAGIKRITSFKILLTAGGAASGTLITDQWTASYDLYEDIFPPVLTVVKFDAEIEPGYVNFEATVMDDNLTPPKRGGVSLTLDGAAVGFSYDQVTGRLTAKWPANDTLPHRMTLEAVDPAGNRARLSRDYRQVAIPADKPLYADLENHWARNQVELLSRLGVVSGAEKNGVTYFDPERPLTRNEMSVYLARALKLDLAQYDAVVLPFDDAASIPPSVLREARALYSIGVLRGKASGGKLLFDGNTAITRAEFCTMLGRSLPRGYTKGSLTFADKAKIPEFAAGHIDLLTGLGVIGGYPDLTFRPDKNITRAEAAKVLYSIY